MVIEPKLKTEFRSGNMSTYAESRALISPKLPIAEMPCHIPVYVLMSS